jgi:RHS repeat-associated protein
VGRLIQTKDLATGRTMSKTYNVGGQMLSETDAFGRTTTYTYNKDGKVASTTNALGQTYAYLYNGSSTTVIDPLGRKTTSTNNDYYLPTSTTYANGAKSSIEYLYTNNLQEAKDYPTRIVDIDGRVRTYGYNSDGNLTTTTDLAGNVYNYGYGENGVSDITSPTVAKIKYEYDDEGKLTKLFYGTQLVKQYTYDADDNVQTVTNTSGEKVSNVYDDKGNITGQTMTSAGGIITSTTATTYDSNGNVASLTNGTGTTSYLYDSNGYVSQITSANGMIISYSRDAEGRILQQIEKANATAIGLTTKYSYDLYGKLLTVTDSRDRTTTMTYDVVNRLATKTLPNGVKTTYTYDDLDRLAKIVYIKSDGSVLASETYTRNAGGEPSKVLREDGTYTLYEYDAANRLSKEVTYGAAGVALKSIAYTYDLDGKRIRKVDQLVAQDYTYNANGQLVTAGQNGYVYDVDGRLSQMNKAGGAVSLAHDAFDRLTQITKNGVTTQYLYDAQGDRIGEVSGSNTKNYLVAPNMSNDLSSTDLVTDGNGSVVSDYVYGGSSIIARLDANGTPLYYLTDAIGSVIGLVDDQGNILSRIIYDGFGNIESGDDGSTTGGDFRFQGQWLESESGLYYMRARNYDAETGLFLSRDPVDMQEQGVEAFNSYQFAFNNPFVYTDPTGLFTITELGAARNIQDSLVTASQRYVTTQAQNYVKQKLGDAFGSVVASSFNAFLPGSSILLDVLKEGYEFEDVLKGVVCSFFDGLPLKDNLFIDVKIPGGTPINSGKNCAGTPYGDKRAYQRSLSKNGSTPDFMFRNTLPMQYSSKDHGAYLVGDVKLFLGAVRANQRNKSQFESMAEYAKKYQVLPFVSYIALSNSNILPGNHASTDRGLSKTDRIRLTEEAIAKGIILVLVNILDK